MRIVPILMLLSLGLGGCKDLTGNPGLPAGTPNPATYNTPAGAFGMRNAAVYKFEQALPQYMLDAGLLTDELEDVGVNASPGTFIQNGGRITDPLDERILPQGVTVLSYGNLQGVRELARQALGALATYDTAAADTLRGDTLRAELYALTGYAEIMLADLFCSGVPLSTLDFQHDFTYRPSSTTDQVYAAALANFDTALTLAYASDSIQNLARVGRGRAWLDRGQFDSAAAAVAQVPTGFEYQFVAALGRVAGGNLFGSGNFMNDIATVSDREGSNGLPFLSSHDPRTSVDTVATLAQNGTLLQVPLTFPAKYGIALSGSGYAPFILASGIEARLMEAEAALHSNPTGSTWVTILNTLRQQNPLTQALPTIVDPIDSTARVDTLFAERAAWLFFDGHRQGDLRRLLRQYSQYPAFQSQQQVYPTGPYRAPGGGIYGTDVTVPIPPSEAANPLFHGCLNREP